MYHEIKFSCSFYIVQRTLNKFIFDWTWTWPFVFILPSHDTHTCFFFCFVSSFRKTSRVPSICRVGTFPFPRLLKCVSNLKVLIDLDTLLQKSLLWVFMVCYLSFRGLMSTMVCCISVFIMFSRGSPRLNTANTVLGHSGADMDTIQISPILG